MQIYLCWCWCNPYWPNCTYLPETDRSNFTNDFVNFFFHKWKKINAIKSLLSKRERERESARYKAFGTRPKCNDLDILFIHINYVAFIPMMWDLNCISKQIQKCVGKKSKKMKKMKKLNYIFDVEVNKGTRSKIFQKRKK